MARWVIVLGVLSAFSASAAEKTVARLSLAPAPGKPPLEVLVTRAAAGDGGVQIKLAVKQAGKTAPLIVYQGGGDEDGAGDKDVRGVTASPFDLADGKKAVRVDFTYHPADRPKKEEQTDTTLVALDGKPHVIAEVRTRAGHDRSKLCREFEETALAVQGGELVATTSIRLEPALGDDDLPIDKTCRSPKGEKKKSYKWATERFVDPEAPAAAPAQPAADED